MSTADLLSKNILQTKTMIENALADFSDAEMISRPAKGANHPIWQMGHLINATVNMIKACDETIAFPFGDDERFGKSKAAIDDPSFFPTKAELMARWNQCMEIAAAWAAKLSDADLSKPTPERLRHFAPTVGSIALLLGSHPCMHLGQFQVSRRALGKAHLM